MRLGVSGEPGDHAAVPKTDPYKDLLVSILVLWELRADCLIEDEKEYSLLGSWTVYSGFRDTVVDMDDSWDFVLLRGTGAWSMRLLHEQKDADLDAALVRIRGADADDYFFMRSTEGCFHHYGVSVPSYGDSLQEKTLRQTVLERHIHTSRRFVNAETRICPTAIACIFCVSYTT